MARGELFPSEARGLTDRTTGARVRQVTSHPSIHHQPFYFVPAYDDAMRRLFFISHRHGQPEIFAELRRTGQLQQLTDRADLNEWSVYPSHDGRHVYYTAGNAALRMNVETFEEELLVRLSGYTMRDPGMVAGAMGTTALSPCDRFWAIRVTDGTAVHLFIIDTTSGVGRKILSRDAISHMMFCPDDSNLLFYAGPVDDRVWCIRRDGSDNRRLYQRRPGEWITHESWIPGKREVAFVDWPKGVRAVQVDTGELRTVATFNAWHAVCDRTGKRMVADTNFPDVGLQLFDPLDGAGKPTTLCRPESSSLGEHWSGRFPYDKGPVKVYAPQHTHPHPSFSPDGKFVCYTSDCSGFAQVYEVQTP